ncbi:MAG TPA: phospholipase D family protein [Chthoniobacterales bacterium]|nr:phospholipase D family protein [Chthoniobacterales bacterium]
MLLILLVLGCGLFVLRHYSRLPSLEGRTVSTAATNTGETSLGRAISPLLQAHPDFSGVLPIRNGGDAFAARMRLAQRAERSLDIQYYLWRDDMTGTLLFQALHDAADRGVRVRLLLDDNNTSGLDPIISALDSHPNIEVRLFNPFVIRTPRLGYLTDFFRANRRMHNKSYTADNQATIIGGRNIGDEYFGATEGVLFVDLDVLAIGPIVNDVSADFDRYWNSDSTYPIDRLLKPAHSQQLGELTAKAKRLEESPQAVTYTTALRDSGFLRQVIDNKLEFQWARVHMVSDDPAKGLGRAKGKQLFPNRLKEVIGQPTRELELVSPYFVPTDDGVKSFVTLAESGVKVNVLTNALEATDVPAVHSGYAKRRKKLLKGGVHLYELRRLSATDIGGRHAGIWGSSGSSLHAKTFAIDGIRVFVGSFNFDPRSAKLNTELGFVIESPALAQDIERTFATRVPTDAYEVHLSEKGRLYWIAHHGDRTLRYDKEPGTNFWLRAFVWLLSFLPIDSLL